MLRRPVESGQYLSFDYTQTLDDAGVLASVGSAGDCYDNALAESFVDSFKTELIADRVWRNRSQLELAIVEWVGLFNQTRLHEALNDRPPAECEALHHDRADGQRSAVALRAPAPHRPSGNPTTVLQTK